MLKPASPPSPFHAYMIKDKKAGPATHGSPSQDENRLVIHEHDFRTNKANDSSFLIYCTTCSLNYCGLCGKALRNKPRCMCHTLDCEASASKR